jgi:hypothetical protein
VRLLRRDLEKDYRVQNRELRTIAHAAGGAGCQRGAFVAFCASVARPALRVFGRA